MQQTLLRAIEARFSCRNFQTGRALSGEELALLLQAGRLAPSAFGLEPWRFLTIVDAPARQAVSHACFDQPAASSAAALIVIVALVDALDPASSYVRARFEAEARGGDAAPIHDAYRSFGRWGSATLPQRTCCCRRRTWGSGVARSVASMPIPWAPRWRSLPEKSPRW